MTNNNNGKYYIIKNEEMAVTLQMLTGQRPFVYPNKFNSDESVFSFLNDSLFREALETVHRFIDKTRN